MSQIDCAHDAEDDRHPLTQQNQNADQCKPAQDSGNDRFHGLNPTDLKLVKLLALLRKHGDGLDFYLRPSGQFFHPDTCPGRRVFGKIFLIDPVHFLKPRHVR